MAKNSLNDWSTTVSSNTDIAGTNIAVGCPPQDVGVYMRTAMAQVAYAVQGSGGAIPATWHVGTLTATNGTFSGTLTVSGTLSLSGTPPGVQLGDVKFSALGIEGAGWRLCYGQTRPRTDPLWVYLVANSLTATWVTAFGGGDGSTTYTMPDARDLVLAGLGNMGGTDRSLITAAISGLNGAVLGAHGGSQYAQDPQLGAFATAVSTVTDPGHTHTTTAVSNGTTTGPNYLQGGTVYNTPLASVGASLTGITVATSVSVTVNSASIGNTQNIQPTMMLPVLMYVGA